MFESRIAAQQLKSYLAVESRTRKQLLGLMTWKDTRRNVWRDIANWANKKGRVTLFLL